MNTDSKLKRFVILLEKAPFILFLETPDYISISPLLRSMGFSNGDTAIPITIIKEKTTLIKLMHTINQLPDASAYNIIEALADASLNMNNVMYFPVNFFTKSDWQNCIEWQNVDTKPANSIKERVKELVKYDNFWDTGKADFTIHKYTVTVDRITHELNTIYSKDLESSTKAYDGVIELSSIDISVPFPKALLKECVADVYEIVKGMSMSREPETIAKSKYMSVMHTGHNIFHWCNLKKIERDLIAAIKANNITIEE